LLPVCLAACTFPTDGVLLGDAGEAPPDACAPATEACDGADNDCDGLFDEGFASGDPCDGPDADLCLDDMMVCGDGGGEVCGDTSGGDNPELCNGADEDCDTITDEGFAVAAPCDGEDGDACQEGANACSEDGLAVVCSDATDTIVEVCDGNDEDCDGTPDDDFDLTSDTDNCGECGVECTNPLGTTSCVDSTCAPVCSNGAAECNGDVVDGCELQDTNPACANASNVADLVVNGDQADSESVQGTTEEVLRVRLVESIGPSQDVDITGRIALVSGAGTDFDLVVWCPDCDATPLTDNDDSIEVGREDANGATRTWELIVEVRYDPNPGSSTCAPWTLTVTGNVATANRCGGT
jgi:hypothetical protein